MTNEIVTPFAFNFYVEGRPAPQGSKRLLGKALVESSKYVAPWRCDVRYAAIQAIPLTWDLNSVYRATLFFGFQRPASHFLKSGELKSNVPMFPIGRNIGDIDKHARSVLDALTDVVFNDDSKVVALYAHKRYCDRPNSKSHLQVRVLDLNREPND